MTPNPDMRRKKADQPLLLALACGGASRACPVDPGEFMCEFTEVVDAVFSYEDIQPALELGKDTQPLIPVKP